MSTHARRTNQLSASLPVDSALKIIGLGGVGGIVSRYLAVFVASLDQSLRLVLIDGDDFEAENNTRMIFDEVGNKALKTASTLAPILEDSRVTLLPIETFVDEKTVKNLIHEGDTVLLCVDNHATRKLVNDHCASLRNICLISGGNDGVEMDNRGLGTRGSYGNVQVYRRVEGKDLGPTLTTYHPEIAHPKDRLPTDLGCEALMQRVPQVLFANLMTASAMLNTFWLYACQELHYHEIAYDIVDGIMRPVPL